MMAETAAETHGPEATACACCEEPAAVLRAICANTDGDHHGDGCARFCPACLDAGDLLCDDCGEICRRCGHWINEDGPWDGGAPVFDQSGWGMCFACECAEEDRLTAEVTAEVGHRIAALESFGVPARRRVGELLDLLERLR